MYDRPILFSGPMVRRLLDGRKTMTRRFALNQKSGKPNRLLKVKTGDTFWVRECFQALSFGDYLPTKHYGCADWRYKATEKLATDHKDVRGYPWRPAIHMPRLGSRLTLEVTYVKTEPLQDIQWNGDAVREGIYFADWDPTHAPWTWDSNAFCYDTPGDAFKALWISLNGEEAWTLNPLVVAISFRVHQQNIDTFRLTRAAA